MDLAAAYQRATTTWSDIYEHLPRLRELVGELNATAVVELGVRTGNSTVAWLAGLEETDGHLWAVDLVPLPAALRHPRLTFVLGDDTDPSVLAAVPDPLDVVFIDSSHSYLHTVAEIGLWAPRVRPGGAVVFHDTEVDVFGADVHAPGSEPPFPVRKAVDEWTAELRAAGCPARIEHHPNNHGLTIVHLPVCDAAAPLPLARDITGGQLPSDHDTEVGR